MLTAVALIACGDASPGYLLHVASGQLQVLLASEPLDQVRLTADSSLVRRLAWVDSVRAYAHSIGLRDAGSSYTRYYDTGGGPISWNVSASPATRLEPHLWYFPFLGGLPYKGYFERHRAQQEAVILRDQGLDVVTRPVAAYSTLGYLPDPLLSTMLDAGEDRLADLLLHELTHATIFARAQTDYNESTATFIGRQGAVDLMQHMYGPQAPQVTQIALRRSEASTFTDFIATFIDDLQALYDLDLPRSQVLAQRQSILEAAQEQYRNRPDLLGSRYDGFLQWTNVNNARLLSYRRYNRDLELFLRIHRQLGQDLTSSIKVFRQCSEREDAFACLRTVSRRPPSGNDRH